MRFKLLIVMSVLTLQFADIIASDFNSPIDFFLPIEAATIMDGCTDEDACNFEPLATIDDGSCIYEAPCDEEPCTNGGIYLWDDESCQCYLFEQTIEGCTDSSAPNYNPYANCENGECIQECFPDGCTDPAANNFDLSATCDDGSCEYGGTNYQITSITPSACPPDSLNPSTCLNVCPFNTQVYVVDGYEGEIEWEVIGAESWEVIGDELLVNWAGPGSGLITASGEGAEQECYIPFFIEQIDCQTAFAVFTGAGTNPYIYEWFDITGNLISNDPQINFQGAELVTFVVTDLATGCTASETYIPSDDPSFEVEINQANESSCGNNDGEIAAIVSSNGGLSGPYSYQWGNGATGSQISGLSAATYGYTVTDALGCSVTGAVPLSCGQCEVFIDQFNPTCSSLGQILIETSGFSEIYVSGPNGYISTGFLHDNLVEGTYIISITESNCTGYEVVELENQFEAFQAQVINASSCNACDGEIILSGTQGLSFNWSNGNTGTSNLDLCTGVHTVTVTDNNSGGSCAYDYEISCDENDESFETSLCIDILEETEAIISTIPEPQLGEVNICAGQTIYFESQSINAETHIWDFGNGENDSGIISEFTFEVPGSYLVQLIARNECLCSDTTSINVNVEQAIIPKLDCIGTVCENTEVTYTTDADCSSYNWQITGDGAITGGGGNGDDFITINWGVGPLGTINLSVASCTENYCIFENITQIPIIGNNDEIKGLTNVCKGDLEVYTITNYGGADFFWEASPFGEIVKGQGTNTISVQWTDQLIPSTAQWVRVEYNNCYLECGGSDELEVNILDEYFFSGPIELCINETGTYSAEQLTGGAAQVNWEVKDPSGAVIMTDGPSENFELSLTGAIGIYTITATPPNPGIFCSNEYSAFVNLLDIPVPVMAIDGETQICVGGTYTYNAVSTLSNTSFAWEINDGGNISEKNGGIVNVTWNSQGPYSLSVYQIENTAAACVSESIELSLTKIEDIVISGQAQQCIETTSIFTATSYPNINYQWNIEPENTATIIAGQGTNTIEVFWHSSGPTIIEMNGCSNSDDFAVFVNPTPIPLINHPFELCPEATEVIASTLPFSSYQWRDTSGILVSTMATPNLGPGAYELIVEDENGCFGNNVFEIQALPAPTVEISSPNLLTYCPPAFPVPTLYALESDPPYQYQWYRNNVLIPGATMSLFTPSNGESGSYKVEAINEYGCLGISNALNVSLNCGGGDGPPIELQCLGVTSDFEIENTTKCQEHKFQNTSPDLIPGTTDWYFGYPNIEGTSTGENTEYEFERSGFYFVVMICDHLVNGQVESCGIGKLDMVPVSPDFHVLSNCVDNPIEFEDLSTFVPGESVTSWTWDFGDPTSGTNNISTLQDPVHTYAVAGTYPVTLLITGPNGCESEITRSIVLQDPPNPSFDLPQEDCQQFPLDFTANVGSTVTDVFWDFGDPASGDANTSEVMQTYHEYETPGTYTISLIARSIYGCETAYSQEVTIQPNALSGVISMAPGSPICEGQTTTMTAPNAFSYLWSNDETTASITTGASGVYNVTISDESGCTYTSPDVILDILPLPGGEIRVTEYDEFDQPITFFYENYTICQGDEVFMEVNEVTGYEYDWNNGAVGTSLEFTIERENLLDVGIHTFEVTIKDSVTGCINIVGPYTVTVNANPDEILLVSDPDGFICDNQPATISISNYDPNLTYIWNTGVIDATSLVVDIPGIYTVRAFNENGCETTSNEIEIHKGPDISRIPSGCHKRCAPDTLCLPSMPGIVSYQWFFNDVAIPAPAGTQQEIVVMESGDYFVKMLDQFGCAASSGTMTLDLFIGTGTIEGEVYFDVNNNGIIDGPDTLMSNQTIFIERDGFNDQITTSEIGAYSFEDILAVDYTLYFDSLSLTNGFVVVESVQESELIGCDDVQEVNWLVRQLCVPQIGVQNFNLCPGETMEYHGVTLTLDEVAVVVLQAFSGCDSTVTVNVSPYPVHLDTLRFSACAGEMYEYKGQQIASGDSFVFEMNTFNGCDSNEVIIVETLLSSSSNIEMEICEGEMLAYNGVTIAAGETYDFNMVNAVGCDSVMTVSAVPIPLSINEIELFVCAGDSIWYNGEYLYPNSMQEFSYQSFSGCDSVEQVSVAGFDLAPFSLVVELCPDETYTYNNQEYAVGTSDLFTYTTAQGCDSLVQLDVISTTDFSFDYETETVCFDELGTIEIINLQANSDPYLFSMDGDNFQTENEFNNLAPGDYMLYVQDLNGCIKSLPAAILVYEELNMRTENQSLTCDIDSVQLEVELVSGSNIDLSFIWPDGSTGFSFFVADAGTYAVQASNICEDKTYEIVVEPAFKDLESYLYVPNVFSPNNDGINDEFIVSSSDDIEIHSYEMHIFDRWGERQYYSKDITEGWDGTVKDGTLKPGVHVWWLKMDISYCGEREEVFEKGDVTVIR